METLAFPIRFKNNHIVSLRMGSDAYYNQLISVAVQVLPGEMALDVDYGIRDMTFGMISTSSIKQMLGLYFPELDIEDVIALQNKQTTDYLLDIKYRY